jgi:hypothetical protein
MSADTPNVIARATVLAEQFHRMAEDALAGDASLWVGSTAALEVATTIRALVAALDDAARAVEIATAIADRDPAFMRSSDGGRICFYCGHLWSYGDNDLSHADDCLWQLARHWRTDTERV